MTDRDRRGIALIVLSFWLIYNFRDAETSALWLAMQYASVWATFVLGFGQLFVTHKEEKIETSRRRTKNSGRGVLEDTDREYNDEGGTSRTDDDKGE